LFPIISYKKRPGRLLGQGGQRRHPHSVAKIWTNDRLQQIAETCSSRNVDPAKVGLSASGHGTDEKIAGLGGARLRYVYDMIPGAKGSRRLAAPDGCRTRLAEFQGKFGAIFPRRPPADPRPIMGRAEKKTGGGK